MHAAGVHGRAGGVAAALACTACALLQSARPGHAPYRQLARWDLYELARKHGVVREDAVGALYVRDLQQRRGAAPTLVGAAAASRC